MAEAARSLSASASAQDAIRRAILASLAGAQAARLRALPRAPSFFVTMCGVWSAFFVSMCGVWSAYKRATKVDVQWSAAHELSGQQHKRAQG